AAARDGHVERRLDLPQVLVERATQPRQALVVDRVQLDFDRLGPSQTSSPRSEWDSTAVIRTSAYERWSALLPGKFTTRLFAVRPASSAGFLFEAPSTSTRWVLPTMVLLMPAACWSSCRCSRCRRSLFSSWETWSARSAAGVPGRGL